MQKILFGIFAHPDDEAFCVAATLLQEAQKGTELHLISLTDGNGKHSVNPDNVNNLGIVRLNEWRRAGELIGATRQHHLGYKDGTLSNDNHIEIAQQIEDLVKSVASERPEVEIEFISLSLNGITGHIDHIVASRSAYKAFYRLKEQGLAVTRMRLACLSIDDFPHLNTDFTVWEPGLPVNAVDETVDMRDQADKIYEIMRAHHSQRGDAEFWINKLGDRVAVNHFTIAT
jgi:LmbE family N-acetylglucosaminyl deacetylase